MGIEEIINIVHTKRNEIVKSLIEEDNFLIYADTFFQKSLTKKRAESVKYELEQMLLIPFDIVHYAKLIKRLRASNSNSIADRDCWIFFDEINAVLKRLPI